MFGHVEEPWELAEHMRVVRELQERTGGITEFVPLSFIPFQTLLGRTHGVEEISREENLKHTAVFRLALGRSIPNLQASWVKMGLDAATEALSWGVNDLGGTLMEESISRLAGSYHGVRLDPPELIAAAHARRPRPAAERTTLYDIRAALAGRSRDGGGMSAAEGGAGEAITAQGLTDLRAELERLETEGRRDIAKRINAARELGDLKENAEYHIAKEDQAHLETRILRLSQRLRNAVVVEEGDRRPRRRLVRHDGRGRRRRRRRPRGDLHARRPHRGRPRQRPDLLRVPGGQGAHGRPRGRGRRDRHAAGRPPAARRPPRRLAVTAGDADVDRLFGLPLERFVAERDALAKALRADGRRDEAAAVKALAKPSVAAWAVNQAVRARPAEARALWAAGDALAGAQEDLLAGRGDALALRDAARGEQAARGALVDAARGLLNEAGARPRRGRARARRRDAPRRRRRPGRPRRRRRRPRRAGAPPRRPGPPRRRRAPPAPARRGRRQATTPGRRGAGPAPTRARRAGARAPRPAAAAVAGPAGAPRAAGAATAAPPRPPSAGAGRRRPPSGGGPTQERRREAEARAAAERRRGRGRAAPRAAHVGPARVREAEAAQARAELGGDAGRPRGGAGPPAARAAREQDAETRRAATAARREERRAAQVLDRARAALDERGDRRAAAPRPAVGGPRRRRSAPA